jgi:predicted nucleotidyltransferase
MLELAPDQRAALTSLRDVWPDAHIVLIGATALRLQTALQRQTHDMDLVIAVDVAAFPGPLGSHSDWAQPRADQPQRWTYRKGTKLDLLPVGTAALAKGHLEWPDGVQMSVQAFDLLSSTELVVLLEEQQVFMAPVPLVMLLKMVAWLDRPGERARDVEDMVWLFSNYPDDEDDYDFARLVSYGFDDSGRAQLLGMDIALIEDGRDISRRFLHQLETHYGFQYAKARGGSDEDKDRVLAAFKRGLGIQ